MEGRTGFLNNIRLSDIFNIETYTHICKIKITIIREQFLIEGKF